MDDTVPLTESQQAFITLHTPLIHHVLGKHGYRDLPDETYQDLVMRLLYRLCICATRYDPERQVKPSSYLVTCFEGEIKNFFRDEMWVIRPPRQLRENSFADALGNDRDEDPERKPGENPETIRTSANPLPLDATHVSDTGEEECFLDIIPAPDNVEEEVVSREGGRQILGLIYRALQPEERLILALMQKGRPLMDVQERFHFSHELAHAAWMELREKVADLYRRVYADEPLPKSKGNSVVTNIFNQRFLPTAAGFLNIRKSVADRQAA